MLRFALPLYLLLALLLHGCTDSPAKISTPCNGLKEVANYYDNGQLKERYYLNCENEEDSLYSSYFRSGRVLLQGYYQNGRKQGEWRDNDSHKNPSFPELPNNYILKRYRNDTLVEEYVHHVPQFDTTCTQSESFIKHINPTIVKKHIKRYDYCNGMMNAESFWINDDPDSIHRTWNEQGQLYMIEYYENLQAVKWLEYDPYDTTQLVKISYFDNGLRSKIEHYKDNKVVRTEYPEE